MKRVVYKGVFCESEIKKVLTSSFSVAIMYK